MIKIKTEKNKGKALVQVKLRGKMEEIFQETEALIHNLNRMLGGIKDNRERTGARVYLAERLQTASREILKECAEDMRGGAEDELAMRILQSIEPENNEE